jgi:hypothetical protein
MRLFTLLAGNQPMVTINAADSEEAMEALCVLLGNVGDLTVRVATPAEMVCWNVSAGVATREQRTEAPPASPPAGLPLVQATKKPRRAVTASGASDEGARPDAHRASRRVNRATGVQFPVG